MFHDVILSHKPIRQMLLLHVSVTFSLLSLGSMTSLSDKRNIKWTVYIYTIPKSTVCKHCTNLVTTVYIACYYK